jgi:hypothetical protein
VQTKQTVLAGILVFLIIFLSYTLFFQLNKSEVLSVADNQVNENIEPVVNASNIEETSQESDYYYPLDICYKESCVHIPTEDIKTFYNGSQIDRMILQMYLLEYVESYFEKLSGGKVIVENKNGSFETWKNDYVYDTEYIYTDVESLLLKRREGEHKNRVEIARVGVPGTDGSYSDKYIEIDHSKQKLYVWIDGTVQKIISISGAYEEYETHGVFPIIDKGINPQAPSGRYMPYWMAFYRADEQDSWYGLHALVWWYDDYGNRVYEPESNIGYRKSAGCLRMLIEDAKYLYNIFDKGDHILIHK